MKKLTILIGASLVLTGCAQGDLSPKVDPSGFSETSSIQQETLELAELLSFNFDNFQCWEGKCKVIYNIDYYGPSDRFNLRDFFGYGKNSGTLKGSAGSPDVGLDLVVLREGSDLAGLGSFDSSISYSVIINTKSTLNAKYQGVLLKSNGILLFEEDFGCFKAKKETVESSPTC